MSINRLEEPDVSNRQFAVPVDLNAPAQLGTFHAFEPEDPKMVAEKRRYYVQSCLSVLRQAYNIRHDAKLMAEIRTYIQNERDELNDILDESF